MGLFDSSVSLAGLGEHVLLRLADDRDRITLRRVSRRPLTPRSERQTICYVAFGGVTMDVVVTAVGAPKSAGCTWRMEDQLGRALGTIRQTPSNEFTIVPDPEAQLG